MYNNDTREKLKNIISGIIIEGQADHCTTTRNYLCAGFSTSTTVKRNFDSQLLIKKEQDKLLRIYSTKNNLWIDTSPPEERYLAKGGEATIYFDTDNRHVLKVNDAVYYATWLEFFNSILIHNILFEETKYEFLGFYEKDEILHAILRQPFIIAQGKVNLDDVKILLAHNGFINTKRNDYQNKELGLRLEDIHDENVIVNCDNLFFIDTVFYIDLDLKGKQ